MSVTIDSLDIQIRSSAGSAAANIDKLALSLGRLQANSKLTAVTNNLTKLSASLSSLKVNSATLTSINGLASAMKSLAAVPKTTGLTSLLNALQKLPAIVNQLNPATLSAFAAQMRDLGAAMAPLSASVLQFAGVGSTLNSLQKLPQIVAQLNPEMMSAFAAKMRELSAALAPLATQLNTVSTAFSKLPARVSQVVTATNRMTTAANRNTTAQNRQNQALNVHSLNLMAGISNIAAYIGMLNMLSRAFSALMGDAIEWDGIQFRFGRAFGEDAEEVLAYAEKISKVLKINKQQFMQYSSLYGSLLSGFGMQQKKVTAISVGLTELSYDIWAAYNDRYKTLEDASEAVRSAITGEIEPIRNAGIALTEASMQEYLDSIGMASVSIEKLSEAQKAEVRYAVMVNAAMNQGIVGTYASEMDNAEGAVRTLSQQLKTLGQALGSLFLPMLKVVVPWISTFVELLTEAAAALMGMLGIPFQEIKWGDNMKDLSSGATTAEEALGDAAKQAKKLKDYTMGFDELNIIDPPSDSGSGGAGGDDSGWGDGLDLETLWDDSIFDKASKQVDELKAKALGWFDEWELQISTIGAALSALTIGKLITHLGTAFGLGDKFLGVMRTIKNLALSAIVITLQYSLASQFMGAYLDGEGFKEYIKAMFVNALGTALLYAKWGTTGLAIGLAVTALVSFKALFEEGGINSTEGVVTALTGIAAGGAAIALSWKKVAGVITVVKAFFAALLGSKAAESALVFLGKAGLAKFVAGVHNLGATLTAAIGKLPGILLGAIKAIPGWAWVATAIITAITGAIKLAITDYDFTDIGYKIGHALGSALKKAKDWVVDIRDAICRGIMDAWEWVKNTFDIDNVFEFIQLMFNPVAWITKIVPKMIEIGKEVLPGLWEGIKAGWDNFWSNIAEFISGFIKGFKDGLGISSPSKKFAEIGGYVIDGLLQGFTNGWKAIERWYKTSIAPKFTVAYWLKVYESLRSAAATKLEETKTTLAEKWAAIVSWYEETIAPKFTLRYWMDQFFSLDTAFTNTIKNAINAGIDLMNKFIGWINSKLSFSWEGLTIAGKEIFPGGSVQLFTISPIPRFEQGGVLEDGLFTMNRGEIAGKFSNGTSVVANNQMIVEGIAAGVYQAVVRAMNEANGSQSQNVNVYLDGKQIYASVKKNEAERGRVLMGNQLGYAY